LVALLSGWLDKNLQYPIPEYLPCVPCVAEAPQEQQQEFVDRFYAAFCRRTARDFAEDLAAQTHFTK
jgi:hypothetical protein